ncbi:DNA annealing helicase and endonuclease ZRANB3-like isoform X2 [Apostichopus japonicus]|uniref:DNA annealing helicase and endonuclease ZRANB3-like isoform X2 n=1 Tax=Stichopus japonicus TaxID=307972 RepID=UPI003AB2C4D8
MFRCLIGDEMGLGKTIQAISVAYYYRSEWPLLVVLPSSMKYPWIEELEKWLPCLQPNDINLINSSTDVSNISKAAVSLVGYGLMQSSFKTLLEALHERDFGVIIVDESHFLKNPKAVRTKTLIPLLTKAKRVLMLSGTPALARPAELYSQINCLSKGQFGSWTNFAKRYCDAKWKFFGRLKKWDTSGACNLAELHKKLTTSVMIRREKKEVLTELPPKRRQKVPFELSESKQTKELDALWSELRSYLNREAASEDGKDAGFEIRRLSMQLYISTGKAKIAAISEYVRMLLDNHDMKFLVFAHHKEILTAIVQTTQAYAREKESTLKYIRIDGDVPHIERMKEVNRFQQDPCVRVAALSIMAAGTGLTLTAASHVVFAELHWTPGVLEQCEDRAHRIGQHNAIHIHYLIAKGTIDEWMWSALNRKVSVLSSTLNGRVQQMNAEVLGEGVGAFLKNATLLPSTLDDEEDDSFFFSQTPKKSGSKDIRSFMQPSQPRKQGTPPSKQGASMDVPSLIITLDDSDDCEDTGKEIETHNRESLGHDAGSQDTITYSSNSSTTLPPVSSPVASAEPSQSPEDLTEYSEKERDLPSDVANTSSMPISESYLLESSDSEYELVTGVGFKSRPKPSERSCQSSPFNDATQSCSGKSTPGLSSSINEKHSGEAVGKTEDAAGTSAGDHSDIKVDKDLEVPISQWNCASCTFLNHESLPSCEICDTPRKRRGRRPRVKTRSAIKKKMKNKKTQNVVTETLSDSDDDFEMLTRVETRVDKKAVKSKGEVKGQKVMEDGNDEYVQMTDILPNQDTPVTGMKEKNLKSGYGSSSDKKVSHHGIDISDSDNDNNDDVLSLDPLRTSPGCSDQRASTGRRILQREFHKEETENAQRISKKSIHVSKAEGKGKKSPPTKLEENMQSSSVKQFSLEDELSDALFSDEEVSHDNREEGSDRKATKLSQSDIEQEVKGAVDSVLNSPLTSRSKVTSWTCMEPSCQFVNTSSDVECENCWTTKPKQVTVETSPSLERHNKFESGLQSPGFRKASELLEEQDQSQMGTCKSDSISPQPSGSKMRLVQAETDCIGKADRTSDKSDVKEIKSERVKGAVEEDVEMTSQETPIPKIYEMFLYCASKFTERIYLYDVDQQPLNCSFQPLDLRMRDIDNLPPVLHVPQNMKAVRRFLKEWDSLTELKKRKLRKSGLVFDSPTAAVDALMKKRPFQLSTKRFLTKDDLATAARQKAEDVGGSVRIIHKKPKTSRDGQSPQESKSLQFTKSPVTGKKRKELPDEETEESCERQEPKKKIRQDTESNQEMSKFGFVQALSADGVPLCVFCNGPVASFSNKNAAWDTRYCSEECKMEHQIRWKSSKYVREQLLEAEHGVCQICNLDAHTIYKNIRDLPKSKRKDILSETAYSDLSAKLLNEMIKSPVEGQFWHADHIIPVYKGGGLCSLENFRTLCVLCHAKVTAEQSHERKETRADEANRKAGLRDIRKFLTR